jgi:hypothetical protein
MLIEQVIAIQAAPGTARAIRRSARLAAPGKPTPEVRKTRTRGSPSYKRMTSGGLDRSSRRQMSNSSQFS